MRFGSVCSGIEAASVAWNPLGWKAQWLSEIEPFPCSLLAHHYPDTPNLGDMTKYNDWPTDDKHAIDLLCGGTPCQSFSVAGLRKGLDDPRGNLMLTFGAIAAKYRPQWLVWENVPGVLSSNGGRDFGSFLGMLGQLGYGFAYRICDAQYHGVAQRRRRVFVVGCLGDWRSAAAVLFERHSLQGHPAPRRQAGQGTSHSLAPSLTASGRGVERTGETRGQDPVVAVPSVAGTMKACKDSGGWSNSADHAAAGYMIPVQIVETLCVATGQAGAEICAEMAPTLNCNHEAPYAMYPVPFDTTQITSKANYSNPKAGDPCHPLAAQAHVPAIAVALRGRDGGATAELGDEVGNALRASSGGGDKAHVLSEMAVRRLTPEECEKLQGFPVSYTNVPHRGKPAADGNRYKALGNSWAVPNVAWIGRRIEQVQAIHIKSKILEAA